MTNYTAPTITELGSVADLTRGQGHVIQWDGFHGHSHVPDLTGPGITPPGSRA